MSTPATQPGGVGPTQPPPGTIACPRCGAAVGPEQDWCVTCGVAARTRVAPVPHWRRPIIVVATVGALALATVAVALVSLSSSDAPPGAGTVTAVVGPPINATTPAPVTPGLETTIGTPTTIAPVTPPAAGTTTPVTPPATTTPPVATTPPATLPPATGGTAAP